LANRHPLGREDLGQMVVAGKHQHLVARLSEGVQYAGRGLGSAAIEVHQHIVQ